MCPYILLIEHPHSLVSTGSEEGTPLGVETKLHNGHGVTVHHVGILVFSYPALTNGFPQGWNCPEYKPHHCAQKATLWRTILHNLPARAIPHDLFVPLLLTGIRAIEPSACLLTGIFTDVFLNFVYTQSSLLLSLWPTVSGQMRYIPNIKLMRNSRKIFLHHLAYRFWSVSDQNTYSHSRTQEKGQEGLQRKDLHFSRAADLNVKGNVFIFRTWKYNF